MFDYMTALQQLTLNETNPCGVIKLCLGTKKWNLDQKSNKIGFDFKGCRKASFCYIRYDEILDLYDMEFLKQERINFGNGISVPGGYKTVEEKKGLYCDQLHEVFEEFTGLRLFTPRIVMMA